MFKIESSSFGEENARTRFYFKKELMKQSGSLTLLV
jgi:hypothetical protein